MVSPLVGYIPLSGKHMDEQFKDLQKQHGDIYLWRMGTQVMVFLHSYQLSKKPSAVVLFSTVRRRKCSDLWSLLLMVRNPVCNWKQRQHLHTNRRFSLRQLRDQGMGKSSLVSAIQKQARELVEALKGQASKPERIPRDLRVAVINIIWHMVANLIDGYLLDIEASKDDPDTIRTERDLCILILDLFFAGSETTVGTLAFMFFYLANHPEVQRKFQAEIDEVLPKGTLATLEDRSRMPFTEAVIHEVLRVSSLASLGIPHVAVRDTTLGGYLLPKGTIVWTAALTMHHDPRFWNDPEKFMPERWLDDQGKFATKKEGFLPFGVGKRVCVGESLVRMELFIISTAIFQSLSVSPPPGSKVDVSPVPGNPFIKTPRQEKVCFTIRE
ncbi:Cytochrome P450 2L1 [Penaeus vannamei]|uniref:Cytochrome P450 2L1 n=1 Tax=Penaeus vannamei TaxID=6689 RepID=A0A423SVY4_PENVA|nr:Cytochrome P450 2L1 [Penaeus vannamei]